MGLFDAISGELGTAFKDALRQGEAGGVPGIVSAVLARTDLGSLNGLVAQLQQGGLGRQVESWLGNGPNLPVSAAKLRNALGHERVQQVARQLGLPVDEALKLLSEYLPTTVDKASPQGTLPPGK